MKKIIISFIVLCFSCCMWAHDVSEFIEDCSVDSTWQIYYTSIDGNIITPYNADAFNVNIVSNTYDNGQGVITFDGEVTNVGNSAFYKSDRLVSLILPNSVKEVGYAAINKCANLVSITFPDSLETIGEGAFSECKSLTSPQFPSTLENIGNGAFSYCSSITEVMIPSGVTTLNPWVFEYCSSLTSLKIPDGVTRIGHTAFYNCPSLRVVSLPSSVEIIESDAFHGSTKLDTIYLQSLIPAFIESLSIGGSPVCYIPCGTKATYEASDWAQYVSEFIEQCEVDNPSTDSENVQSTLINKNKVLHNGQVLIHCDGKTYNVMGKEVK